MKNGDIMILTAFALCALITAFQNPLGLPEIAGQGFLGLSLTLGGVIAGKKIDANA